MGRRRGLMSEEFKYELAKDLGFYETVVREGWEGIRTKDAGNMVKRAIQIAEEKLAKDYRQNQPIASMQQGYRQQTPGASPQRQQPSFGAYFSPSPVGSFVGGAGYGQQRSPQTQQSQQQQQQRSYPQPQQQ